MEHEATWISGGLGPAAAPLYHNKLIDTIESVHLTTWQSGKGLTTKSA